MLDRRRFLTAAVPTLAIAGSSLSFPVVLDGPKEEVLPDGSASRDMVTPRAEEAIERGKAYLTLNRQRDGSYGTGVHSGNVAITSLAALAFMAGGTMPNRGQQGRLITDALRFVLAQENRDRNQPGYLYNPDSTKHGPMYGHGFATLFLAEISGQIHDRQLREQVDRVLHRAVELILKSQNIEGGRYTPTSREADLSVTVCQIMALRGARNVGIDVPKAKVDKCVEYVKRCQDRREGYFRYMLQMPGGGGGVQAFARTAAGVAALHSSGIYKGKEVDAGIRFLRSQKPGGLAGRGDFLSRPDLHYFYGHYYGAQVMWTTGGEDGANWFPAIRNELLGSQQQNGSWVDQICPHYATAMALLILQVPNNYLTIFQK